MDPRTAELEDRLKAVDLRYSAVIRIVSLLGADRPISTIVQEIGRVLQEMIPFDRFSLGMPLLNRWYFLQEDQLTSEDYSDRGPIQEHDAASGWVLFSRKPVLCRNIPEERRFKYDSTLVEEGMCSDLIVPLIVDDDVVGTFNFTSREPNCYSDGHLETAQSMAAVIAAAAKRLQTQQEEVRAAELAEINRTLTEKDRLLTAFHRIGQLILSTLDLDQILDNLPKHIVEAGIFRSLMIALVDEPSRSVEVVQSVLLDPTNEAFQRYPNLEPGELSRNLKVGETVIGYRYSLDDDDNITAVAARTGQMQLVEEWDSSRLDSRFDDKRESWRGKVAYFIPVKQGDRVLAVLATASPMTLKEETLRRIDAMRPLLDQVAIALEHARLYKQAQEHTRDLSKINRNLTSEIAERKQAEEALRESEGRFRAVVQSLGEGLLITDVDDVILDMNSRMTELTGYTPEEMIGRKAYELLLPPEQHPILLDKNRQRVKGVSERYELQLNRKDGSLFWTEINATPPTAIPRVRSSAPSARLPTLPSASRPSRS